MKKTYFKLQLFASSMYIAETIILAAARSNGGYAPLNLKGLQSLANGLKDQFPMENQVSIELVGETSLHIDANIGGNWEPVAIIEEVEIMEILKPELNYSESY